MSTPTIGTVAPAIELHGVGKRYHLSERSLVSRLIPSRRAAARDLWANRGLDLTIQPGETVGILGRNGAGKSTLLRMLAGVSAPSEGRLTVRGRIAPLISVGVGFHPELTGRENVYVNGMLLGLTRAEVDARFDQIVDFAELADRIDTPVKFYSSGMFMRLGFSVAIHVDPDVLLVDEVLAVGDVAFQLKCFNRMRDLVAQGTTIVLVSHSMHAIQLLCTRALVFGDGAMVFDGPTSAAVERHHQLLAELGQYDPRGASDQVPTGDVDVEARLERDGVPCAWADQDTDLVLTARLRFRTDQSSPHLMFRAVAEDGQVAHHANSPLGEESRTFRAGDEASAEVRFRPAFGGGGSFRIELTVTDTDGRRALGRPEPTPLLYVPPRRGVSGFADLQSSMSIDDHRLEHRALLLGADPDEIERTQTDSASGDGDRRDLPTGGR